MSKMTISLIIDDGSPVNTYYFHNPKYQHELPVPAAFFRRFADLCRRTGIRGKYSVVPCPGGIGRIDRAIPGVSAADLQEMLSIIRKEIAPSFSLTPEIMTHWMAWDFGNDRMLNVKEDAYFSHLDAEEIASYVGNALQVLLNCDLEPKGITSPWMCGLDNEENYARGIGMAFRRVLKKERCFYFLHYVDEIKRPEVRCDSAETGRVVTIPANAPDVFWDTQNPVGAAEARENVRKGIDSLLSEDGRSGLLRELADSGLPLTLTTHWQSLFSEGRAIGLEGLDALISRIGRVFGDAVEWKSFEEIADSL